MVCQIHDLFICLNYFLIGLLQGILADTVQDSGDHKFTLVEASVESGKTGVNNGSNEELLVGEEDGESSVASVEDQLRKEMTVYEVYGYHL